MSAAVTTSLTSALDTARSRITGAIQQASDATGASFEYLLATAKMESNFNPSAGASTSSARGLYQFIDQTWLGTVKEAGAQLGYGNYADAITKSPSGNYSVSDPAARAAIMRLRDDPVASSAMAGVLTQSNSFNLTGKIGRRPTDAELYMAHFMGVGGAARLINVAEDNPQASAARLFPNAAAANRSIFYERGGRARSVSEVYSVLNSRYDAAANSPATQTALASLSLRPPLAVAAAAPARSIVDLPAFPDLRALAPSAASFAPVTTRAAPREEPIFRTLFQVGERSNPVSSAVRELWGNSSSLTSVASAGSAASTRSISQPTARAPQPLDLFSDRSGTFSG
jgi:hypothetical protein